MSTPDAPPPGTGYQGSPAPTYDETMAATPSAAPPTYPFPPGTPAEVPADFEAAAVERALSATQLSPEEIAEFRQLRADKKKHDEEVAEAAAAAAAKLSPPTHHVHLADGSIVAGSSIETHWATEDGDLLPVTGAWPRPEYVSVPA